MKKVSIVLPVYNGEKYLEDAIKSVIAQTYGNWELIIVDDCSTDRTTQIVNKYKNIDSRIKVIQNDINQKLPNSLNIGFKSAVGEYFTWTSDDNMYREKAIEKMVSFLNENPQYGMVYCDVCDIDDEGSIIGTTSKGVEELYYNNCIGACFLYRREVAKEVGEYNPDMFLVEDYEYWLRIDKQYAIYHIPQCQYDYRRHTDSLTQTRSARINEQLYKLRIRELEFLLERTQEKEREYLFLDMWSQNQKEIWTLKQRFFQGGKLPDSLGWMERKTNMESTKKIILFGAGEFGRKALDYLGQDKVEYYVDNNKDIQGRKIAGKKVISFEKLREIYKDYQVVISVDARKIAILAAQLEKNGITEYKTYLELVNNLKNPWERSVQIQWNECLKKATEWLVQNSIPEEGIINNSNLKKSYPEVTGYYIPTLMRWGYRDMALSYAKWLCSIQKENGAWHDTRDKDPYVFDTAQILKGLLAVREFYPETDESIKKGCDWILNNMQENGRLTTPAKEDWGKEGICSELIHLYCLSPLIEAGNIYKRSEYKKAARKIADYYIENHKEEILNFNILSHFYAYIMEGLCDIGEMELAKEAMEKVALLQRKDGSVPAYADVNWICSTGLFQFAIVWYKLGDTVRGNQALTYATGLQNETGGWYGSYPVRENPKATDRKEYPDYFPTSEISWVVKYFLDAVYYKCKLEFEVQADSFKDNIEKTDGRYQLILQEVKKQKAKKVCDVGCGKGRYIKNLMEDTEGILFYAVDMSERVMEFIEEPVEKRQGTLTGIPYKDESFDVVYTVEALEHAIMPEHAIKELIRVTKKGGKIVIIDKNKSAMGLLEVDEWEQWFDDKLFIEVAKKLNCQIEIVGNITYEDKIADGLFNSWILTKY